jgi:hypothetical protein
MSSNTTIGEHKRHRLQSINAYCTTIITKVTFNFIFKLVYWGGLVQLVQFGTPATNRRIVPAPGDYDDEEIGGMIGRGNRSTRIKPAPMPLCSPQTPHACPDAKSGRRVGKPVTNRLSYGTAKLTFT